MTQAEINFIYRMLEHLSRLFLNGDVTLAVYEATLQDLIDWKENKLRSQR